jgi:hypothetical protein
LDPPREAGPILCVSHNKQLVIAAGNMSKVICWHSIIHWCTIWVAHRLH